MWQTGAEIIANGSVSITLWCKRLWGSHIWCPKEALAEARTSTSSSQSQPWPKRNCARFSGDETGKQENASLKEILDKLACMADRIEEYFGILRSEITRISAWQCAACAQQTLHPHLAIYICHSLIWRNWGKRPSLPLTRIWLASGIRLQSRCLFAVFSALWHTWTVPAPTAYNHSRPQTWTSSTWFIHSFVRSLPFL